MRRRGAHSQSRGATGSARARLAACLIGLAVLTAAVAAPAGDTIAIGDSKAAEELGHLSWFGLEFGIANLRFEVAILLQPE